MIERGGRLQPVEIKAGATVTRDALRGLERWCELADDVLETYSDITDLARDTGYRPQVSVEEGPRSCLWVPLSLVYLAKLNVSTSGGP